MSYRYDDEKKRPPPINIPPFPLPPSRLAPTRDQQREARNASNSTHYRSNGSTPLTTPVEPTGTLLPPTGSGRSRKATFTEVSRVSSPRKSDHGSTRTADSHGHSSTARSKQSERSRRSAVAAQAQLEALGEETVRGQVESRHERNLFKMTGQIPPTPTTDAANEDEVYIRTEDLRAQCRAASGDKQQADDQVKSPKKKLFSSIRNPFTKTSNNVAPPPMPSKAAQVFGTAARQPKVVTVRPIKPARPFEPTPTKAPRSDTSKSLPAKVIDPDSYAHRHRSGSSRRNRPVGRGSPSGGSPTKQSSDAENAPPMPKFHASFESVIPPTPPAKDTPPDQRAASPLRRVAPAQDLRESYSESIGESYDENYGRFVDKKVNLRYPDFALSPLPSSDVLPGNDGASPTSPTKFRPYTADDYTKLIEGEALQWPYPERGDSLKRPGNMRDVTTLVSPMFETPKLRRPDRRSEEHQGGNREGAHYSPLKPRFYSPKHLAARGFPEGESPSKNSDTRRLLYSVPSKSKSLVHLREDSNDGSIKMIFQGDASDIDPNSPTGQDLKQYTKASEMRSDPVITTRVMQELRINEPHDTNHQNHQNHGHSGHLQPDQSSSRLTDMLNTVSPGRSDSHGEFRLHCPSAVPSPLHRLSGPVTSARSIIPSNGSFGQFPPAHPSKSVDDHFFMTNEHLDVVGKTTWDMLDATSKRQSIDANIKHDQMKELIEKRLDDIKSEINTVKEKAESTADNQHKVFDSLNSVSDILKENIPHALSEQDKKLTSMEVQIKELKQMMQALQKSSEQKLPEPKVNIPSHVSSPFSLPDGRSQPSSAGQYSEPGRDGQPPMPHMHDNRNMASPQDGHNDLRAAYHKGYPQQQWASRPGYSGHNVANKETNPYHFANGGQYSNGYGNGYSSFNYSPSPPDYPFNPGQAK